MIYSPIEVDSTKCYEYQNTDILRIYDSINLDQENTYTDYNTANHYNSYKSSVVLDHTPVCIAPEDLTHEFYYRNDIAHICVFILFLLFIIIYMPFRLFSRFFKKGLR